MSGDPHTPEAAAQSARQEAADERLLGEIEFMLDCTVDDYLPEMLSRIIDDARGNCTAEDVADYTIGVRDVAKILRAQIDDYLDR